SWNSVGQAETQNWAGSIGANVAATVFQFIGLAGYLLPLLMFAAAWRRFSTRSIQSPLSRIAGLIILVVAASALLSIAHLRPLFDSSVQPGGLLGAVVAEGLASGLNRIGATVVLVAVAAMGLLLATNISFVRLYAIIAEAVGTRFAFVGTLPERFRTWRQQRNEQAQLRKETKAAIKLEREAAKNQLNQTLNLTAAERVADFMKQPIAPEVATTSVIRAETKTAEPQASAAAVAAGAGVGTVTSRPSRRIITPDPTVDEDDGLEEMVKGVSVLRTKAEA